MNRKHLILPAALLAGSAVLAGRAGIDALPLGTDARPSSNSSPLVGTSTSETDPGTQTARSTSRELPALPAASTGPTDSDRGSGSSAAAPVSTQSRGEVRAVDGHGGRGRDHPEDDGTVEDDAAFDDHGGDRPRGEDSSGRHGGDDSIDDVDDDSIDDVDDDSIDDGDDD